MTDTKSRRFSVHVPSDNQCLQSVCDYMASSKKGLRTKVFEACEGYYYPLALMNNADTDPDEILDAAISAVNQLHQQIQYILEKLQQQGIQPTPAMLIKAGHISSAPGYPTNTISPAPPISITSTPHLNTPAELSTPFATNDNTTIKEGEKEEEDDDDEWGEAQPLSAARLAYMKQSEEESRINSHG